jgi:hypothetical protein
MSALRLLTFGVLTLSVSKVLAAPHAPQKATATQMTPDEALKVPPTTDPPRSKPPATVPTEPTLYKDTSEPNRHLILEAALGATAGIFLATAIPLIENAYSESGGAIAKREAERDASYALFAVGGILGIADLAIAIADHQRSQQAQKARLVSTSSSSAMTLRF